jgi:hypothetical protein
LTGRVYCPTRIYSKYMIRGEGLQSIHLYIFICGRIAHIRHAPDGLANGEGDGRLVGRSVGLLLGRSDGRTDGREVGFRVGQSLGWLDGIWEGFPDGFGAKFYIHTKQKMRKKRIKSCSASRETYTAAHWA